MANPNDGTGEILSMPEDAAAPCSAVGWVTKFTQVMDRAKRAEDAGDIPSAMRSYREAVALRNRLAQAPQQGQLLTSLFAVGLRAERRLAAMEEECGKGMAGSRPTTACGTMSRPGTALSYPASSSSTSRPGTSNSSSTIRSQQQLAPPSRPLDISSSKLDPKAATLQAVERAKKKKALQAEEDRRAAEIQVDLPPLRPFLPSPKRASRHPHHEPIPDIMIRPSQKSRRNLHIEEDDLEKLD